MSHLLWREIFRWPSKGASRFTMYRNRRLGEQHQHNDNIAASALRKKNTFRITYDLHTVLRKPPHTFVYSERQASDKSNSTWLLDKQKPHPCESLPLEMPSLPHPWKSNLPCPPTLPRRPTPCPCTWFQVPSLPFPQPFPMAQLGQQLLLQYSQCVLCTLTAAVISAAELLMLRLLSWPNWLFEAGTKSPIPLCVQNH